MKIYSQAPCRIGIFGSGTDTKPYAEKYGGIVLNMAINIRQHLVLDNDSVQANTFIEGDNQEFFNKFFGNENIKIWHDFDGKISSGLGSSAALAVALEGAAFRFHGLEIDKIKIAERAWEFENNELSLYSGRQDQYASSLGGINVFEFGKEVKVNRLQDNFMDKLLPYMQLYYLGVNRKSPKIQEGLKKLTKDQITALNTIKMIAIEGIEAIGLGNIERVGQLLNESWANKKKSNNVSNDLIDSVYEKGKLLGALGFKLCGSGQGGHVLFLVEPKKQKEFKEKIGLEWIDFGISLDGLTTRII